MNTNNQIKIGSQVQTTSGPRIGKVIAKNEDGSYTVEFGKSDWINNLTPITPGKIFTLTFFEDELKVWGSHK